MKTLLFALLSICTFTLSYSQTGKVKSDESFTTKAISSDLENKITISSKKIIIQDRLDLEADSAQYNSDKKILTAFGTKKFSFNGKVIIDKDSGVSRFYLDEANKAEAIVE
jgi:hypothetical protein